MTAPRPACEPDPKMKQSSTRRGTLDRTQVRARIQELMRAADRKHADHLAALRETFA